MKLIHEYMYEIILVSIAISVVAVLGWIAHEGGRRLERHIAECNNSGGVLIDTRSGYVCFKKEAVLRI